MAAFTAQLGKELLAIARSAVEAAFSNRNLRLGDDVRKRLSFDAGVFVNLYLRNELRGSFGYLPGTYQLADGIKRAARGAAFMDSRFSQLTEDEFKKVRFEVVLIDRLLPLKVKRPEDYFKKIDSKKHGLFISYGPFRATQLPMFAAQRGMSARDYLEKTIEKSGLAPESWSNPRLKVFVFGIRCFTEKS
ncbi:AmmeMemoRadiSam system protein A [Candidatus Woesearchaeota archaeon]|nr:AmmeMemoRadiSam system protein A [Candidatus Woesearchaeota archaeon]